MDNSFGSESLYGGLCVKNLAGRVEIDYDFDCGELVDFDDFTGFDAAGADANIRNLALVTGADVAKIRIEAAFGQVVGVRNTVPKLGTLTANITSSRQFPYLRKV